MTGAHWVLTWIRSEPFRRADFGELPNGNCRLSSHLCTKLAETAPTWGKLLAPWAEYVAQRLWASTNPAKSERRLSTPLTQRHRRIAKNQAPIATTKLPTLERLCRGCGTRIPSESNHCGKCNVDNATKRIVEIARAGRIAGHTPQAIAKEAATHRKLREAQRDWKVTDQPDWLTERFFRDKIQPGLSLLSGTAIANQIGVSRWYGGRIRDGYIPHPRHWRAITRLVGLPANEEITLNSNAKVQQSGLSSPRNGAAITLGDV